ncbi:MAG: hypothetical protein K2G03_04575, partial [Bacilli bacterium]|nr:hypothetical protein [Bacilli bacterium]
NNSKVLLSIRQMTEGFHTDGAMQIVFCNKTKAYRDFLQKFGRGCSLGNKIPVSVLDLGGNLTRISSLDFLNFRSKLSKNGANSDRILSLPNVTFGGNIVDLNNYIESICQATFVSKREKADIYFDRIVSNGGYLKNPKEQFKDGTYLKDWYKEMLSITKSELKLYKENPNYKISGDNMYIISVLAYLDNYLRDVASLTLQDKRKIYYEKSLEYGNILPRSDEYRFLDGTYMSTWYNEQKKQAKGILKQLEETDNCSLSEKKFELIEWIHNLHIGLKEAWLYKHLGLQIDLMESEKYQDWKLFSEAVDKDQKLLKTKKLCEGIEKFYSIEDYCTGTKERMEDYAGRNFSYSQIDMTRIEKHLVKKD